MAESSSILKDIKKLVQISDADTNFDTDVIIHINSTFMELRQMGIGPANYVITGETETWENYLGSAKNFEAVKTYIGMKLGLIFDPPGTGPSLASRERLILEYGWRLNIQAEGVV